MIETAVAFDVIGNVIYWHEPNGRTAGSIPDDYRLWQVLWENRERLGGVAHSHPGSGFPSPSHTDLTTFRAVERGLGKALIWPIVTTDKVAYYSQDLTNPEVSYIEFTPLLDGVRRWGEVIDELRRRSYEHSGRTND